MQPYDNTDTRSQNSTQRNLTEDDPHEVAIISKTHNNPYF